jgi:prepilin-type N-terminal cleavage/methylation domain-containing protein
MFQFDIEELYSLHPRDHQTRIIRDHDWRARRGFTLIELLIVIAIISILAAVAIPQFIIYRTRSIDAQMHSDLRNAAVAMEAYYTTNGVYPSSVAVIPTLGFNATQGVTLSLNNVTTKTYQLTATKPGGTQASFVFDSSTGSIQ